MSTKSQNKSNNKNNKPTKSIIDRKDDEIENQINVSRKKSKNNDEAEYEQNENKNKNNKKLMQIEQFTGKQKNSKIIKQRQAEQKEEEQEQTDDNEEEEEAEEDGGEQETGLVEGEDNNDEEEGEEDEEDDFDPLEINALMESKGLSLKSKKDFTNNISGLENSLNEIMNLDSNGNSPHWLESLSLTSAEGSNVYLSDPHNDLSRESTFYKISLGAVRVAINQLVKLNIPFQRPNDYFAEMIKPDHHMGKIKDALIREQTRLDNVANRKMKKEQANMAKSVKNEKMKLKQEQKKAVMDITKKARRAAKHNELTVERSSVPLLDQALKQHQDKHNENLINNRNSRNNDNQNNNKNNRDNINKGKSRKRRNKDEKYGFGGPKKRIKSNDAKSASDMKGFSAKKNKSEALSFVKGKDKSFGQQGRGGRSGGRGQGQGSRGSRGSNKGGPSGRGAGGKSFSSKNSSKSKRPGKSSRQQSRSAK